MDMILGVVMMRLPPGFNTLANSLMQEKGMSPSDPILMRIYKEDSKAEIWKKRKSDGRYALLKSYDICRFSGKLGPKVKEGDKQAPEGFYSVAPGQMTFTRIPCWPHSRAATRDRARTLE